jgi:hypothetical protein
MSDREYHTEPNPEKPSSFDHNSTTLKCKYSDEKISSPYRQPGGSDDDSYFEDVTAKKLPKKDLYHLKRMLTCKIKI